MYVVDVENGKMIWQTMYSIQPIGGDSRPGIPIDRGQ